MGRKRVAVQYIDKEKKRAMAYDKRKKGLLKMAYELSTLCDVPVCMVIYQGPNSAPVTYPEKQEEVAAVIGRYVSGSTEENSKRKLNLQQGLELGKRRKTSDEQPCSRETPKNNWVPALDGLSKKELLNMVAVLDYKLHRVEERMRSLTGDTFGIWNCDFNGVSGAAAVGAGFDQGIECPDCDQCCCETCYVGSSGCGGGGGWFEVPQMPQPNLGLEQCDQGNCFF